MDILQREMHVGIRERSSIDELALDIRLHPGRLSLTKRTLKVTELDENHIGVADSFCKVSDIYANALTLGASGLSTPNYLFPQEHAGDRHEHDGRKQLQTDPHIAKNRHCASPHRARRIRTEVRLPPLPKASQLGVGCST